MSQKGFSPIAVVFIILAVLAIGGAVVFYKNKVTKVDTPAWSIYQNTILGILFKHPPQWPKVEEHFFDVYTLTIPFPESATTISIRPGEYSLTTVSFENDNRLRLYQLDRSSREHVEEYRTTT